MSLDFKLPPVELLLLMIWEEEIEEKENDCNSSYRNVAGVFN